MEKFGKLFRLEVLGALIAPTLLIAIYIAFLFFLKGALPTSEEIINHLTSLYKRYGYEVIFLGALLESLLIVNFFVPGSLAVALGAVFARAGQVDLTVAILTASFGAVLGYILDFLLGYFGFGELIKKLGYGEILKKLYTQIERSGVRSFALGFIHPNIGCIVSLAAGTLKLNFLYFVILALTATFFWVSFWGLVVFALGEVFLTILTKYIFIIVLMVSSAWILLILFSKNR